MKSQRNRAREEGIEELQTARKHFNGKRYTPINSLKCNGPSSPTKRHTVAGLKFKK